MAGYARTFRRLFTRQSFARLNTKLDLKPLTWPQEWGRSDKADLTFPPHAHKKADVGSTPKGNSKVHITTSN